MNLGEQLDELRTNVLHDRSDLIAGDSDSLWSDETLLRYIGDAERRFARRTLLLRDGTTPEAIRVKLKEGVTTYPAHKSVIAVLSARYDTATHDLHRSGHGIVNQQSPQEFLSFDPSTSALTPPGAPIAFYTDETLVFARQGGVTVSVYPVPGADEADKYLYLRVIRLPMSQYDNACLDKESEIPEDYQLDVLSWAAYRALRGFDSDSGAPTSAESHKAAFEDAITKAIQEMKRKMFANTGLQYGGNGFVWTR